MKKPLYTVKGNLVETKVRPFPTINIPELLEKYKHKLETHQPKFIPQPDDRPNFIRVESYIVGAYWRRRPHR